MKLVHGVNTQYGGDEGQDIYVESLDDESIRIAYITDTGFNICTLNGAVDAVNDTEVKDSTKIIEELNDNMDGELLTAVFVKPSTLTAPILVAVDDCGDIIYKSDPTAMITAGDSSTIDSPEELEEVKEYDCSNIDDIAYYLGVTF